MARRDADLASEAKGNGGDGILMKADQSDFLETYSKRDRDHGWQCYQRFRFWGVSANC